MRFTAAFRLFELGVFAPLRDVICTASPASQVRLCQAIAKTGLVAFKGTDLDYACSRALERLNVTSAIA